uniref:Plastid lipid-associated protein/fibrillin conserved domain-containing protein n=1 Tax=Erythrolobus australicus TaxID=1077150 RepID=A0A7S1TKL5_9RHOD|mmetsp:Transcript_1419/g.3822  ORF Transcript_1419/g.3822 Transcript_1419/m.3822 type:complete len:256 (+) Transcript_1419:122-889(+)|eukprot:CAMPEP_0185835102 /NCGR_PEP_ID=MMETSP1353-20130828/7050_1 /TAXON_ID=1077150 /ORGANISM="Erythrolobus australicus, Strain CCMP3124" /LENGTH=255 /DNA_ID=CAMNT_0028533673 /DNA_START=80 /DNA_END=847 /DNA_ORIENTATION=-
MDGGAPCFVRAALFDVSGGVNARAPLGTRRKVQPLVRVKMTARQPLRALSAVRSEQSSTSAEQARQRLKDLVSGETRSGRGRTTAESVRKEVLELVDILERSASTSTDRVTPQALDGDWRCFYTTRESSASPIQRLVVGAGADVVPEIYQTVSLSTSRRHVSNKACFETPLGKVVLHVIATVTGVEPSPANRLQLKFTEAFFELEKGTSGFRLPYPVPFRLLGKKACGWLDVTYLEGNLRISRGNKGTIFVLSRM